MTTEARELYCYCTGTLGQRFDEDAIHNGELWVRGLVRGAAQQYLHDYGTPGDKINNIWTDKDIADVAEAIMAERQVIA